MNTDHAVEQLIAGALYGFVRGAVDVGVNPAKAMTLAAFGIIEGTLGREATNNLGVPRSTAARWRTDLAEIGEASAAVDEAELVKKVADEMHRLVFPELREYTWKKNREGGE